MKKRLILFCFSIFAFSCHAKDGSNIEELQKEFNSQIMSKSFHVESDTVLSAELDAAIKKGVKPVNTPSKQWKSGYTCADIRGYSWRDYRNCRYYHRYYGRYW